MILKNAAKGGGPGLLEFCIEKNTSTPVVNQIEEQVKIAVMMGILRSGDTLPSIRDIEKQTGINRNQIHKAYVALRRSGLLVLTRGKGSVVTSVAVSPRSISENCRRMSREFVEKVRHSGISPTAFARFFSRYAQENERDLPLISYVDMHEELAKQTADEISQLWQVPVRPVTLQKLRTAIGRSRNMHKILVNHVMTDVVGQLLPEKQFAVIPIEVYYSEQTIRHLNQIKANSSVLLVLLPQQSHRVQFMIAQIGKLMRASGIEISAVSIDKAPPFEELVRSSQYDYILVGPAVRGDVPQELRHNPRIVLLNVQIDPASLEAARIRTGVVI
jgi:DNA-binding transcriptional regulator YhcF (GntR family)